LQITHKLGSDVLVSLRIIAAFLNGIVVEESEIAQIQLSVLTHC
jgi:hypothetical protein